MGFSAKAALLLTPALLLAGGAWLRSVPGEWSRSALLAWVAVALAHLAGTGAAGPAAAWLVLPLAFLALALGGTAGLGLASAMLGVIALLAVSGFVPGPWWGPALLAVCALIGAVAGLVR